MRGKNGMLFIALAIMFFPAVLWGGEENTDQAEMVDDEEVGIVCTDLKEKIGIIRDIYSNISVEFKKVSDKVLCYSTSEQCEYFYSMARSTQKEYRESCDPDYEIAKVEKCDYSENPCTRNRFRTGPGSYAGASPSVKDNPFSVKILTLFTGE